MGGFARRGFYAAAAGRFLNFLKQGRRSGGAAYFFRRLLNFGRFKFLHILQLLF